MGEVPYFLHEFRQRVGYTRMNHILWFIMGLLLSACAGGKNPAHCGKSLSAVSPREIRLCCLVLVGIPVSHLVYLFDRQRNYFYVTRKNILEKKLKCTSGQTSLKEVLLRLADDSPI